MFGIHRNFPAGGGTDTSDATATAADILTGKTAYGSAGTKLTGTYSPYPLAMMQFDGSTGYYDQPHTSSGSAVTVVARIERASTSGGSYEKVARAVGSTSWHRFDLIVGDGDHADTGVRDKLRARVQNSSGTVICDIVSESSVADEAGHMILFAFDGVAGTALLVVDEAEEDDTGWANRVAPTAGTLDAGASSSLNVGSTSLSQFWSGKMGFVGHADAYLTNYEDFMDGNLPRPIDESGWTQWGAQPLYWNYFGKMDANKGSAGNMNKNGTIVVANY